MRKGDDVEEITDHDADLRIGLALGIVDGQ